MTMHAVGIKRASRAATDMVAAHGITNPPVPVDTIVRDEGLRVVYERLPNDTSAVLVRQPSGERLIGVNARHPWTRQQFSLAHELGHAVLHFTEEPPEDGEAVVDRPLEVLFRDGIASEGTNRVEIDANSFAAGLLMPQELVRKSFREALTRRPRGHLDAVIAELARAFEVSTQAMTYRLVNLNLIDPA